ncbi:outer membrane protein assembly factor BamB family protein [Peristeroidobacter soli]|uniref:outer membrane protein assembly factor BamB family protein n=1 Tax=Peristeroidobacter soli TaxID=2497877 RepID=UPI0015896996|nr:PQQ-binding-like beta-propeller repeat protein [Peristeroidobacter soli]
MLKVVVILTGFSLGTFGAHARGALSQSVPTHPGLSAPSDHLTQYHSSLKSIDPSNVKQLGLAWYVDLPGQRTLQATPREVDGTLYFSGTNGWVFAVDARSGQVRWQYDPELSTHPSHSRAAIFGANRGVEVWKGMVYVGTVDGRLVALEAKSGKVRWSAQTFDEPAMEKIISGAPRACDGKIVIGQGGYDLTRSYVTAYDAKDGRKLWRFHTVPGDPASGFEDPAMEMASKTWSGEWWKQGGHGTVWESIVCDPKFNRVYFGTASAMRPDLPRSNDKLFTASIVALDADTGKYAWHYQMNPGDTLEYDAASPIVLADLTIADQPRAVLMQAPKNGFFYVIDRVEGKLISAEKIGKVTWADRIDLQTGRPVVSARFAGEKKPAEEWPSAFGMHNWQPMSFSPDTGLMYVPTIKLGYPTDPAADQDNGSGGLLAWDPRTQKKRWEVRLQDSFWNGGVLSTSGGVVFQGTGRGYFNAYNAASGEKLWSFYAGLGINAAPMSYALDGVQYVAVLVGFGGTANSNKAGDYGWRFNEQQRRLLVFALGKSATLPPGMPPRFSVKAIDVPTLQIDTALAARGAVAFDNHRCSGCHGFGLNSYASIAPDLRESQLATNFDAFKSVVREGALASAGMPAFDHVSDTDLRAIFMYVRAGAREAALADR